MMRHVAIALIVIIAPLAAATVCQDAFNAATSGGLLGGFVPQCDEATGLFVHKQCHAGTGECWCVDAHTGERTQEELTECDGEEPVTEQHVASPCEQARDEAEAKGGADLVACEEDGSFSAAQCNAFGMCHCVDEAGNKIEGSERPELRGGDFQSCEEVRSAAAAAAAAQNTPCKKAQSAAAAGALELVACEEDGSFSAAQCNALGMCYCVDADGNKIEGSDRPALRGGEFERCEDVRAKDALSNAKGSDSDLTPCQKSKAEVEAMPGVLKQVSCEEDGSFSPTQCTFTGLCHCVTKDGTIIPNSERAMLRGGDMPSCEEMREEFEGAKSAKAGCQGEREKTMATNLVGAFVPQCDEVDPSKYARQQCHGSTGYCHCVDPVTGSELLGTKTGPTEERVDCLKAAPATGCASVRAKAMTSMLVGNFVPQCDETDPSKYAARQCHASTGSCFCVDAQSGKELLDTRSGPGETPKDCVNEAADRADGQDEGAASKFPVAGYIGVGAAAVVVVAVAVAVVMRRRSRDHEARRYTGLIEEDDLE